MKICKFCNKEIENPLNSQKYHKPCFKLFYDERNKEYLKKYREQNKEKIKENSINYAKNNKEKIKESRKQFYIENKKRLQIVKRIHYYKNSEKILIKMKEYRDNNKDIFLESKKRYCEKYPEKIRAHDIAFKKIDIPKNQLCEICNDNLAEERHHEDYSKPLEIKFLCSSCHHRLHRSAISKQILQSIS